MTASDPASRPQRIAPLVGIAIAWPVLEAAVRAGGTFGLGPLLSSGLAGDQVASAIGFPLIAAAVVAVGLRVGISATRWDVHLSRRHVMFGAALGVMALAVSGVAALADRALFPTSNPDLNFGVATSLVLLAVNGLVVPVSEELAWRGVIQTGLVGRLGPAVGITITAILFSLKHAVVDASPGRLFTLIAFGLSMGLIRHRLGTGSSMAAHAAANLLATSAVIAQE